VANQLQAVGGVAPVRLIVMARVGQDMRFGQPNVSNALYAGGSAYPLSSYFQMQGALGDDEGEMTQMIELVPNSVPDYPVSEVLFGEEFLSVRPFFQKFSQIDNLLNATNTGTYPYFTYPHFYPPPATTLYAGTVVVDNRNGNGAVPNWTWFAHYTMMFVGVRGSTRYKLIMGDASKIVVAGATNASDATSLTDHTPVYNQRSATLVDNGVVMNSNTGRGVEFTIPYYGFRKWNWTRFVQALTSIDPTVRQDVICIGPSANTPVNADSAMLFSAGGPDTTVNRFRRTPTVILSSVTP